MTSEAFLPLPMKKRFYSNYDGITPADTHNLTILVSRMSEIKDEGDDYRVKKAFVDYLMDNVKKKFLKRVWYSIVYEYGVEKPDMFSSFQKLCEGLFDVRKQVGDKLEEMCNESKVAHYLQSHWIADGNDFDQKPTSGTYVNFCKMIENDLVRIGKAVVVDRGSLHDEMVRISITELVGGFNLIHADEQISKGLTVDWNWKHLVNSIGPMKGSGEDYALKHTFRPRTIKPIVQIDLVKELADNKIRIETLENIIVEKDILIKDLKRKRHEDEAIIVKLQKHCENYL